MVKQHKLIHNSEEFVDAVLALREGPPPDRDGHAFKPSIRFIAKALGCSDDRVRQVLNIKTLTGDENHSHPLLKPTNYKFQTDE